MTDDLIAQFKGLYLKTAREYITILEHKTNIIGTKFSQDSFQHIFMAAHSLKSQSLAMGYTNTGTVSRALELYFQFHIQLKKSVTNEELEFIKQLISFLKLSLESIEQKGHEKMLTEEENNILLRIQND